MRAKKLETSDDKSFGEGSELKGPAVIPKGREVLA